MKAGDIMTTGAATVQPDASLAEAVQMMVEHRVSGLPVVDRDGNLVGIVTEGDFLPVDGEERSSPFNILMMGDDGGHGLRTREVREIMSRNPITVGVETSLEEAVERMVRHKIKRLPVVAGRSVVGILSRANILLALLRKTRR